MSTLMRAPKECGSWFWDLEETAPPGLESAMKTAETMAGVLKRLGLLFPYRLEYDWYVLDSGYTGVGSTLSVSTALDTPDVLARLRGSRPTAFPDAQIDDVHVVGSGTWIDAAGNSHREPRLLELSVSPQPIGLAATLAVHHDVWKWYDFFGRPHPEVYNRNAPRLAQALRELNSVLGVEPEPGEPTIFGAATELGIDTPDPYDDGSGPDVSHRL
ncbi:MULTISPECIES: hypothetical protein [Streptomyces]|uniref:hypothetical protein n=1 Tax=Streptomyces TaxID=1883 RepID=UPI001D147092|nr:MULTISPECIES: hypothetical protein [Streptomyces]MCC3653172.1 hypothetical protein [Streptomyces sp. S07_1.15]WSQ72229.1 hypothetical protein OG463_12765 [Streptomyces xinghaiensis]